MSDIEEPPTKVTKYEMSQTFTQVEELEEGQEEWLSEGLLTDDDYNPENSATDPDRTRSDLDSQADPTEEVLNPETGLNESAQRDEPEDRQQEEVLQEEILEEHLDTAEGGGSTEMDVNEKQESANASQTNMEVEDSNIEQTLTNMGDSVQANDELDAFLIRNEDSKTKKVEKDKESDGYITDDLLRMLQDDDKSKKAKITKPIRPKIKQQKPKDSSSDDDDDYIFDGASVKKLTVAKNALMARKYPASKAQPEESTDDESSEEGEVATMKKMFGRKTVSRGESKPPPKQFIAKQVVRIGNSNTVSFKNGKDKRAVTSTHMRSNTMKSGNSVLKSSQQSKSVVRVVDRPSEKASMKIERKQQLEHDEIINEEEFLEEDDFDLREDFAEESDTELDKRVVKQRIMRPERMDEDMMSDAESHSEDGSLYDELPSSESEDMNDWFTLDIRGERAGDYLPLLGNKAYDLLLQEKARVSNRLSALRDNLSALNATGRQQAEKLRRASTALAEVDDMLKAA